MGKARLLQLTLKNIEIASGVVLTTDFRAILRSCPYLEALQLRDLVGSVIGLEGIPASFRELDPMLHEYHSHLQELHLIRCPWITLIDVSGLPALRVLILEELPSLTSVLANDCDELVDLAMDACPCQELSLGSTAMREIDLSCWGSHLFRLQLKCPGLKGLLLSGCRLLSAEGMQELLDRRSMPSLQLLDLTGCVNLQPWFVADLIRTYRLVRELRYAEPVSEVPAELHEQVAGLVHQENMVLPPWAGLSKLVLAHLPHRVLELQSDSVSHLVMADLPSLVSLQLR